MCLCHSFFYKHINTHLDEHKALFKNSRYVNRFLYLSIKCFPCLTRYFPQISISLLQKVKEVLACQISQLHKKAGDIFDPLYMCVCVCGRGVRIFDYWPWDPGLNLTLNVNLSGRWVLEVIDPGRQNPCMCQLWKMPKNYTLGWHKSCE